MVKLVILVEPLEDWTAFEETWPQFLHLVESLPQLRREATGRVNQHLYGNYHFGFMYELFFDSLIEAQTALASPTGSAAGQLLQKITQGKVILFFTEHKEESLENIRKRV
jgi:uncharacterized protein (TIGR02118 family)